MTTTNFKYGLDVIEFYPHDNAELQELVKRKEVAYFRNCQSPAYPDLGANVAWVSEEPLTPALNELADWLIQGYTVATSLCKPLYLSVQLKKPATIVDADLLEVSEQAKAEYAANRYTRNVEETNRQVAITVARKVREAEAEAAQAAADKLATIQGAALTDLLAAYSKPTKPKTKKADEVVA